MSVMSVSETNGEIVTQFLFKHADSLRAMALSAQGVVSFLMGLSLCNQEVQLLSQSIVKLEHLDQMAIQFALKAQSLSEFTIVSFILPYGNAKALDRRDVMQLTHVFSASERVVCKSNGAINYPAMELPYGNQDELVKALQKSLIKGDYNGENS